MLAKKVTRYIETTEGQIYRIKMEWSDSFMVDVKESGGVKVVVHVPKDKVRQIWQEPDLEFADTSKGYI